MVNIPSAIIPLSEQWIGPVCRHALVLNDPLSKTHFRSEEHISSGRIYMCDADLMC